MTGGAEKDVAATTVYPPARLCEEGLVCSRRSSLPDRTAEGGHLGSTKILAGDGRGVDPSPLMLLSTTHQRKREGETRVACSLSRATGHPARSPSRASVVPRTRQPALLAAARVGRGGRRSPSRALLSATLVSAVTAAHLALPSSSHAYPSPEPADPAVPSPPTVSPRPARGRRMLRPRRARPLLPQPPREIGRASCRERVYVLV